MERTWTLFTDWCAAFDRAALPTDPETLLLFLQECPVAPATMLDRVRTISRVHRGRGLPDPADQHVVSVLRAARGLPPEPIVKDWGTAVERVLVATPTRGWPEGMVGRRDACLVVLALLGRLTQQELRSLDLASITIITTQGSETVTRLSMPRGDKPPVEIVSTEEARACPVCAYTRWRRVVGAVLRRGISPVRRNLTDPQSERGGRVGLHDCARPIADLGKQGSMPLFRAIDRHGWSSTDTPLSFVSIRAIIKARLASADEPMDSALTDNEREQSGARLDVNWTSEMQGRGVRAKEAGLRRMAEVDAMLDGLDVRIEDAVAKSSSLVNSSRDLLEATNCRIGRVEITPGCASRTARRKSDDLEFCLEK